MTEHHPHTVTLSGPTRAVATALRAIAGTYSVEVRPKARDAVELTLRSAFDLERATVPKGER